MCVCVWICCDVDWLKIIIIQPEIDSSDQYEIESDKPDKMCFVMGT